MTKIVQFAFKSRCPPPGVVVIDCRVLLNPFRRGQSDAWHWEQVRKAVNFHEVVAKALLATATSKDVWIGCLYGKHRSVVVTRAVVAELERFGLPVEVEWHQHWVEQVRDHLGTAQAPVIE